MQKIRTIDKLSSNYEISKKLIYEVKEADLNEFKFTKLDYLVYSSTYDFQYVALIKRQNRHEFGKYEFNKQSLTSQNLLRITSLLFRRYFQRVN